MVGEDNPGLASFYLREKLVKRLYEKGISDPVVLRAMQTVERHKFVDSALASQAYEDTALPIGHGQTISQPYIVARMTEVLLSNVNGNKILEIGTGCGYQTAVLSSLFKKIYSVERINETIENLDEIYKEEKEIDEYCSNNPWTYSGT